MLTQKNQSAQIYSFYKHVKRTAARFAPRRQLATLDSAVKYCNAVSSQKI